MGVLYKLKCLSGASRAGLVRVGEPRSIAFVSRCGRRLRPGPICDVRALLPATRPPVSWGLTRSKGPRRPRCSAPLLRRMRPNLRRECAEWHSRNARGLWASGCQKTSDTGDHWGKDGSSSLRTRSHWGSIGGK